MNTPAEAGPLAKEAHDAGLECLTLHVGWGTEGDEEAAALIGAVLEASAKYSIPLYPETHRATIFQDPWRTVQFLARFPSLEFNGDFSHWYTGTEMVYGGFENKLEFIRPVLGRIGFMHGRIGNPCCMQVGIGDGSDSEGPYVGHFRALWTEVVSGLSAQKAAGRPVLLYAGAAWPGVLLRAHLRWPGRVGPLGAVAGSGAHGARVL